MRVLAIEGGGIRGIVPATVLVALEERAGRPVAELFDLIAGTSTGGIIACALVAPGADPVAGRARFRARDVLALYHEAGPVVFGGEAPEHALEATLRAGLGDLRLSDALTDLLVTAYDARAGRPHPFASWAPAPDRPLWEVARATSAAAPTFGPLHTVGVAGEPLVLIDGGEVAVDPTPLAHAEALRREPAGEHVVVSLGTGETVGDGGGPGLHRFQVRLDSVAPDAFTADAADRARLQALADALVVARTDELDALAARLAD
ncbi:MAG: patatin-like phospholipase family protein [Solirubrobacterales bacterium]|nr:patatin-like phospholipase family protein [Solirubrobacterales bacterium]